MGRGLTDLSKVDLPTFIGRMSPFPILGMLGGIFFQILIEHSVSKH